jgi:hypothetical protein
MGCPAAQVALARVEAAAVRLTSTVAVEAVEPEVAVVRAEGQG